MESGLRIVIRNHQGQILASLSEKVKLPSSIDDVKAMVAVKAVSFASGLGFSSIIP